MAAPLLSASLLGVVAARAARDAVSRVLAAPAAALSAGTDAVSFVGSRAAALSYQAADAFPRIGRPLVTLVPDLPSFRMPSIRRLGPVSAVPSRLPNLPNDALAAVPTTAEWGNPMGNSGLNADHFFPKPGQNWSGRIDTAGLSRFLRTMHPEKTAAHVAAATRLPADTVKKWLAVEASPNGRALLVLACVYGPEVMTAMLREPPGWLDAQARQAEQARLDGELTRLTTRMAERDLAERRAGA